MRGCSRWLDDQPIAGLKAGLVCGARLHLDGRERAGRMAEAARRHRASDLQDRPVAAGVDHVNREGHTERMDAAARRDDKRGAIGERCASEQAATPCSRIGGEFHGGGERCGTAIDAKREGGGGVSH